MPESREIRVSQEQDGERIDKTVSGVCPQFSRSAVQHLIAQGCVTAGGRTVNKSYRVSAGETVAVALPDPVSLDLQPENIPLDIRYEDDFLLVVNKPRGMVVHPAPGHSGGTLVNALLHHCGGSLSGINGVMRPGIVHRIDKDTSGLLMVAKNDTAHLSLARQIQDHTFKREYYAVAHGRFRETEGTVDAPIGRHPQQRKKMAVTEHKSKHAVTHFKVLEQFDRFAFLRLRLETGRTHQIRVHMAYLGHPLAGDEVYGPKKDTTGLNGQCLHAGLLGFHHPVTGEYLEVRSELPDYFTDFLRKLGGASYRWCEKGI